MVQTRRRYESSELDGTDHGFFVVINVDSPYDQVTGCAACETPGLVSVFASLADARRFCEHARKESGNELIFVYALAGVQDAFRHWPDSFAP